MTIASLLVNVATNQVALVRGVDQINAKLSTVERAAARVRSMLAAAFSVTAIIGAIQKVGDYGGRIADLSSKMGTSTRATQRWQFAFDQAGSSIEAASTAVTFMNRVLTAGKSSTVAALTDLGLRLEDLRRMGPERAFEAIADAIARVPDPMRQSALAVELLGRSGAELLPAFKAGLKTVGDDAERLGHVLSEDAVKGADELGDAWASLKTSGMALLTNVLAPFAPLMRLAADAMAFGAKTAGWLRDSLHVLAGPLGTVAKLWQGLKIGTAPKAPGAPTPLMGAGVDIPVPTEAFEPANVPFRGARTETERIATAAERAADAFARWRAPVDAARAALARTQFAIGESVNAQFGAAPTPFGNVFFGSGIPRSNLLIAGTRNLSGMATLPRVTSHMPSSGGGGGNFFGNVFSGIGGSFKNTWEGMTGGEGMSGLFKNIGGGLVSGGLSALLNFGVQSVGKLFGKIFGKSEGRLLDEKASKDLTAYADEWIRMHGGIEKARETAKKFGHDLDGILGNRGRKGFENVKTDLADIDRQIDLQATTWAKVQAAVERYGFTIEEIGPALQRQALDTQAQQIFEDFMLLTAAGIKTETVLKRMADAVNKFVQTSVKVGIEIPNAMRPMLQQMLDLGLLFDADGNKITSFEQAGIKFTESMSEGFDRVVDSINEMTRAIRIFLGITDAAADVVDSFPNFPVPEPTPAPEDPIPMAAGGMGRVTRPTFFLAGERGPEDFAFSGAGRSFGGGGTVHHTTIIEVDGREFARVVEQYQSSTLRTRRKLRAA